MKHRNRLEQAVEALGVLDIVVGDVGEVLAVHTEIRIEVGDDHVLGVKAHGIELPSEHRSAVGHSGRLAHHDAGEEWVLDMEEGA